MQGIVEAALQGYGKIREIPVVWVMSAAQKMLQK